MVVDRTAKLKVTGTLNLEVVDYIYRGFNITNTVSSEKEIRRRNRYV